MKRVTLTPGSRFGTYDVLAAIGRGGMGDVFRAHDSTLGRDVALKVLSEHGSTDPDRRRRLKREARTLAALSHPNIAAIYGYEEYDGVQALVLELIEGATLADRLVRGPLPLAEALNVSVQIADALETAHDARIIHRDLKPANVKVRPDGLVKVLDFGLAKTLERESTSAPEDSPTITVSVTKAGAILGTAAYMSPEQARGLPVDKRADVWAFGCVVYEMLTGRRAFGGERATDVMASVLREDPNWDLLPADTPSAVRRMLQRCLAKDVRARLRDLGDAQLDLRDALTAAAGVDETPTRFTSRASRRRQVVTWAAVAIASGLATGVIVWNVTRLAEAPETLADRLAIIVPATTPISSSGALTALTSVRGLTISPDGRRVVYIGPAASLSESRLYVRSLEAYEPRPIDGTEGASAPFFSPDSQTVAFFAAGKLKRMSIGGGTVTTICDAPDDTSGGSGGTWGPDDTIVFAGPTSARAGLYRVSAYGGTPEVLATPDPADEGGLGDPTFIPGTDSVMFTTRLTKAGTASSIVVRSLRSGQQHRLALGNFQRVGDSQTAGPARPRLSRPQYTRSGHLVFKSGSTIMAAALRPETLQVTGPVVPIVEGVADFSVSAGGRLGYVREPAYGGQPVWVDRQGSLDPIVEAETRFGRPRLSPSGNELAMEVLREGRTNIGIYRFNSRALTLLTTDGVSNSPSWHPDGRRVVFRVPGAVVMQSVGGTGPPEMVLAASDPALRSASSLAPGVFSPVDALTFLFVVHGSTATGSDIFRLSLGRDRRIDPLVQRSGNQWAATMSPDGRWISYASDETGRFEVYVEAATGGGTKLQVSNSGGSEAVWAPAGNELFYRAVERMMAVPITNDTDSPVGVPRVLFTGQYQRTDLPQYDVSRDGQRFVMIKPIVDEMEARTIWIVDGWANELKARVRLAP